MQNSSVLRNFVVLEGIDGAGTTTQLHNIADRYTAGNIPHWTTCEPTGLETGKLIRRVLKGELEVEPETLARLFVADRHEHLYGKTDGILAHLERGELVVTDRYLFSSLAYQSVDCDFELVKDLNSEFPLPELLVYIDVPFEVGEQRAADRGVREIFEYVEFQKKALSLYEKSFSLYSGSKMEIIRIDGTLPADSVFEKLWSSLAALPIQKE